MNKPPNQCLFCGQPGNMTRQHVFPDRLGRVLPQLDPGVERRSGARSRIVRRGKVIRETEAEKFKQGTTAQYRIRKVCLSCNNGWLKKMEENCFPLVERIILGEIPVFQRSDQERLAKAAMSIAFVGEWISADYVSTTQAEREAFKATLHPPSGWYVFIGRDGSKSDAPRFLSDGCTRSGKFGREAPVKQFASFTMTMGPLLLHVISLGEDVTFFDPDDYADRLGLAAICPPTDWINFGLMPALNTAQITSIRTYATMAFRQFNSR